MAAGRTFSAQKALNTCADHEHEELDMYCKTCKKPVCTKCVKEDHRSHDWDTLAKIAKALRKDTRRSKMEMQSVSKSILIGMEDELKNITLDEESQFELNQSEMELSRKAIIESVNQMFDEMKSKSQKVHEAKIISIQGQREKIRTKKQRVEFLIQNMETGAKDYTDVDLIELHNEIKQLIGDMQRIAIFPDSWYIAQIYGRGTYDKSSLATIVGHIKEKEPISNAVLETEFRIGETPTNCIKPRSENEAWIHSALAKEIKLIDKRGLTHRTIDLKGHYYNFAVSSTNIVYFRNRDSKEVNLLNKEGDIACFVPTAPLIPLFVNVTRSDDLLVTLVDEESDTRERSSRRLLRRISSCGVTLREYEYDEKSKSPLFCKPCSTVEHPDGRICLLDIFQKRNGALRGNVFCFDYSGNVHFKYNGIEERFNPLDICCAPQGNTLVSDACNRRIHILDSNGTFLRFLLTEEKLQQDIYAIALKRGILWVGTVEPGFVKVFKYTH